MISEKELNVEMKRNFHAKDDALAIKLEDKFMQIGCFFEETFYLSCEIEACCWKNFVFCGLVSDSQFTFKKLAMLEKV